MIRILTFGVFDFFHYGHLRLLERCKILTGGDFLIVAVQDGNEIHKNKPETKILYSTQQRVDILKALKCVDQVCVYKQVWEDIKKIDFDILVVGGDQNSDGIKKSIKWCEENDKKVIKIERTPNISSSEIKKRIENLD